MALVLSGRAVKYRVKTTLTSLAYVLAPVAFSFGSSWGKLQNNFFGPTQPPVRVFNPFTSYHAVGVSHLVGPTAGSSLSYSPSSLPPILVQQYGSNAFGYLGASKPHTSGHGFGPYGRSTSAAPNAS
ncbi:hypothetical protein GOBAR_AA13296 [Gossypium barbadense]|uniref:Uncharacterized protein n=1 Tax=Gossypium barbadense TaxID=3634 RepID=A0A2P5XVQ3_GOSBA|nr:hypothetical protein GOBAR_AA13296 [Gossypium barbadense]